MHRGELTAKRKDLASSSRQYAPERSGRTMPGPLESMMSLQRKLGNHAVAQLLKKATSTAATVQKQNDLQSYGAISLDLAGGDVARTGIINNMLEKYGLPLVMPVAVEIPGAFATEERAEMTMQFLNLPHASLELAAIADRNAGAADDRYLQMLKLMLKAKEAAGSVSLSDAQLEVICSCADEIGDNKSHLNVAVQTVVKSESLEAAQKKLSRIKKFNFNEKLEERVDSAVKKKADLELDDKLRHIKTEETEKKKAALEEKKDEASKDTKVKKAKTETLRSKLLEEKQQALAKPKLDEITQEAELLRKEAKGPGYEKDYDELKSKYADYYQSVHFHPLAEKVLSKAYNSIEHASIVMDIVMLGKDGEKLFGDFSEDVDKLIRLSNVFTTQQIGQLLQMLKAAGLAPYLSYPIYMSFLRTLFLANVPGPILLELSKYIGKFQTYCTDPTAVAHFITLVQVYTVKQIVDLLQAAPPYEKAHVDKMGLLVTLSPKAAAVQDLLAALRLCEKAEWNEARVLMEHTAWPNGSNAATLELAIQSRMMANINKDGQFEKWIRMLAVLVDENYHTITYGNVRNAGSKTKEVTCTVAGNGLNETFVVHGHPGAEKAKVGATNASDIHLKPRSGHNIETRMKREQIPKVIWDGIGKEKIQQLTKS
ncbi:hypothetical protein [Paenibacillus silviterrae]|uniref:hypothetical protein n=1 Tax=Paenibacillus silviterrae TaxID=3242194 RepID=UPI0025428356|nr:hypothetical protein [Paenibacillus chinjuensis]